MFAVIKSIFSGFVR